MSYINERSYTLKMIFQTIDPICLNCATEWPFTFCIPYIFDINDDFQTSTLDINDSKLHFCIFDINANISNTRLI